MDGPVDPARLLIAELVPGAFDGVSGAIRPDWDQPLNWPCLRSRPGAKLGAGAIRAPASRDST